MLRMVNANDEWFDFIKTDLQDGEQRLYRNCELPSCCNRDRADIAIERSNGMYHLIISGGLSCNASEEDVNVGVFKYWLEHYRLSFDDYNDVKQCLQGFSVLYR